MLTFYFKIFLFQFMMSKKEKVKESSSKVVVSFYSHPKETIDNKNCAWSPYL